MSKTLGSNYAVGDPDYENLNEGLLLYFDEDKLVTSVSGNQEISELGEYVWVATDFMKSQGGDTTADQNQIIIAASSYAS
jgi:hypothetical protein